MSEDGRWWERARCRQIDPEVFFGKRPGDTLHYAKQLCFGCPVQVECLADSLRFDAMVADGGIFGGFGTHQRRILHDRVLAGHDRKVVALAAIREVNKKKKWAAA